MTAPELRTRIAAVPRIDLAPRPTAREPMPRLADALGCPATLHVKRDDALGFAFGGNKVRKLAFVAAAARAAGADTLVTAGGIQSNHARVTAAVAAKFGMRAILVVNGARPAVLTANARLDDLMAAEVVYVPTREARAAAVEEQVERVRRAGGRPFAIPIGASTPLGALGFVDAVAELLDQGPPPDVIVHSTSSGGTQAGIVAACRLLGLPTRVIGISADDPSGSIASQVEAIVAGIAPWLGLDRMPAGPPVEVDDGFVGGGYGVPTPASEDAIRLAARTEALFLDPTYTAKAMAALIAYAREGRFKAGETVLFWHTGGQVALFAH